MTETKEINDLVTNNVGLVHKIVQLLLDACNIQTSAVYDYDDYLQTGMMGLMNAAKTFDQQKGAKFSTYACTCIKNKILEEYRMQLSNKQILNFLCCELDGYEIIERDETGAYFELLTSLRQYVKMLKRKGRDIELGLEIALLSSQGSQIKEAAAILHVSYSKARRELFNFRKTVKIEDLL